MKFTNVKQLIIKFMGGGLINFPTRFLRWVKINGDTDDSDDGGSSDSDVFFVPATIQPKYFVHNANDEPIEIKDYTPDIEFAHFLYNKEDIISLGIEETDLNSLTQVTVLQALQNSNSDSQIKRLIINKEVFKNTTILANVRKGTKDFPPNVNVYTFEGSKSYIVYKISDDIFVILESIIHPK